MNRTLLIPLVVLAAATACGQTYQSPRIHRSAEMDRRNAEYNARRREAQRAEATGDYAAAESLYKEAEARYRPGNPFERIDLARLYDKAGRDRDAFVEYRAVLAGAPNSASSLQREPAVLARYGDLCLRFTTVEEARTAYTLAVAGSSVDDVWDPRPTPRNASLGALKAAAHTAVGFDMVFGGGRAEARHQLDLASAADPDYWVAYYYRAILDRSTGDRTAEIQDAATAERLATPKGRRQVRWMRAGRRIPDLQGHYLKLPPVFNGQSPLGPPEIPDPAVAKAAG